MSRLEEQEDVNGSEYLTSAKERKLQIKKSSAIYKLDSMKVGGLLFVDGRLKQAPITYAAKQQIILPDKHEDVDLIVGYYYLMFGHSRLKQVLTMVQGKFCILKPRTAVMGVVIDCKGRKKKGKQKMADLPTDRVIAAKPPFTLVGIDCFGPFPMRKGESLVKRYGVLLTCMSIRPLNKHGVARRVTVKTKTSTPQ